MARKLHGQALKTHLELLTAREKFDVANSRCHPIEAFVVEFADPGQWTERTAPLPLHKAFHAVDFAGVNIAIAIDVIPLSEPVVRF